jgi:hypothetical protein
MNKNEALFRLMQMQMGFLLSASIYVAAKLELADQLAKGAASSSDLAERVGADADMLYRIMRYLASEGVFEERPGRVFAQTPLSEMLRAGLAGSFHPFAIINSERAFETVLELLPAVRDGDIPFVRRFGQHPFEMMHEDPEAAAMLERAWQGVHGPETDAVLDGYDFTGIRRLADIGGGHGDVVVGFLERDASRTGAIFDIPAVATQIEQRLADTGLSDRCEVVGGDFFKEIPVKADAYFLRHILHDWNDAECRTILDNIARQCERGNRILIAECVIKEPNIPDAGKLLDMEMLLFLSGKERTEDEYRTLLEAAGFDFSGVTPTDSMISVVEGVYAP